MGKHKPTYVSHVDSGDYVVVLNARHAVLTGNKMRDKLYKWHTGWFGGLKTLTARQVHERAPERLIEHAVKGMLPPNATRKARMTRLRIFAEGEHEHARQVAASARYAPEYLAAYAPARFEPPPPDASRGELVQDLFRADMPPEARAQAEAALVREDPAVGLQRLEAALAAEAARKEAGETAARERPHGRKPRLR